MSLVHDALKRIADGQAATTPARRDATARVPAAHARRHGRAFVAGICIVVAPLAFLAGRGHAPAARPAGAVPVAMVMPAVLATLPPAPAKPARMTVATAPAAEAAGPPARPPAADRGHAGSPRTADAAQTTLAGPDEIRVEVRQRKPVADGQDVDARDVRQTIAAMEQARIAGDRDAVHAGLRALSGTLRPDSLTLLRMQAWVAHGDGDLGEAERLYRTIADRVPDDQNAAVNLALLQARHGDIEAARARLQALATRKPASAQVAQALAEIGVQAQ